MSLRQSKTKQRQSRREGIVEGENAVPFPLRMRRILFPSSLVSTTTTAAAIKVPREGGGDLPVTTLTCAIPWESRRTTPICEGVAPFFASLQICSTTCSGVVLSLVGSVSLYSLFLYLYLYLSFSLLVGITNQLGGVREYGIADAEIPFPLE